MRKLFLDEPIREQQGLRNDKDYQLQGFATLKTVLYTDLTPYRHKNRQIPPLFLFATCLSWWKIQQVQ
ncbi:hypothetical protein [Zooshikella harenae]|uniref:Transposase n=1 Tax=Zooshikella harenae TaxID=2827238 RepID=A0ABS5ZI78_9GAMM|nr:hypothetical protein [Zooshikella harenae]MBU2713786.1 hypothetical protein [Zooshikella harenae]